MTNQVTGSVRSRKKWKKLIDTAIQSVLFAPSGEEHRVSFTVRWPHFYRRPEWLPEGTRKKLLDKSAIWVYNSKSVVKQAYENNLTDTSFNDILEARRKASLEEYDLEAVLEIKDEYGKE